MLPGDRFDDVVRAREDAVLVVLRHAGDVPNEARAEPSLLHLGGELRDRLQLGAEGPAERREHRLDPLSESHGTMMLAHLGGVGHNGSLERIPSLRLGTVRSHLNMW